MTDGSYSYTFPPTVDMKGVEESLLLATLAVEGMHGRSCIQLDASYRLDSKARVAEIDGSTAVGAAIARVFTALLSTTIGEAAFKVDRIRKEN